MKNLILIIAFLGFMISPSFATTNFTSTNIEFCEDGKKCDKKGCKKGDKKECKKGDKKACCTKKKEVTTKKSCCAGKTAGKSCSKSKAAKKE